jgi:hypothetical protein
MVNFVDTFFQASEKRIKLSLESDDMVDDGPVAADICLPKVIFQNLSKIYTWDK